jgi:Mg-chelatase subunit ChlD
VFITQAIVAESLKEDGTERVILKMISKKDTQVEQKKKKMMLELTDGFSSHRQSRLALVAVLDVSGSMKADNKLEKMKNAILFVIKKLSPVHRLSIVVFSTEARMIWPMQRVTENSQKDLEDLVNKLEADNTKADGTTNIFDGLRMGLNALSNHKISSKRAVGIILMSNGMQSNGAGDAAQIPIGNIAVHTFGFGKDHDPTVRLHYIINLSLSKIYIMESLFVLPS